MSQRQRTGRIGGTCLREHDQGVLLAQRSESFSPALVVMGGRPFAAHAKGARFGEGPECVPCDGHRLVWRDSLVFALECDVFGPGVIVGVVVGVPYGVDYPACFVGGCDEVEEPKEFIREVRRLGGRGEQLGAGAEVEEEEEEDREGEKDEEEAAWTGREHFGSVVGEVCRTT